MMNNMNNINNMNGFLQQITAWKNQGKTPQQVFQMLVQQNPQYQTALTQLQNMAQGKNPQEFVMQLAKQNGATEENLQTISQIMIK